MAYQLPVIDTGAFRPVPLAPERLARVPSAP